MNSINFTNKLTALQGKLEELSGDAILSSRYLNEELERKPNDKFKLELLLNLAEIHESQNEFIKLNEVQMQALPLARKYKKGEALLKILTETGNNLFFNLYNITATLELNQEVIYLAKSDSKLSTSIYLAHCYSSVGVIFYDVTYGDMTLALNYLNKALNIYTQIDGKFDLGRITNNIGLVYKKQKKYEAAIPYHKTAIEYLLKCDSDTRFYYRNYVTYCCNLSNCFIEIDKVEEAAYYLELAETIKDKIPRVSQEFIVFCWGMLAKKTKDDKKAIACFLSNLALKNYGGFLVHSNSQLGNLYFEKGELQTAIPFFNAAIEAAICGNVRFELDNLYEQMSQIYEQLGNKDACISMLRKKEIIKKQETDESKSYYTMLLDYEFKTKLNEQELKYKSALLETQNELNDQLQEANKELTTFAHRIAHDLKEPLRMLNSYSKLLGKYIKEDSVIIREFLGYITQSSKQMNDMVTALLDFAVIDKNLKEPTPVSLSDILILTQNNLTYQFTHENVEMKVSELPQINGYSTLLLILFQNLLANSIKFKREDPIKILIYEREQESTYVICVGDNGIGMKPSDRERVFEMFLRLNARTKYEGLGIGLATCKKIMEIHQGKIEVESELGKGTTFILSFPK
jgi:signal transduction histidine kinase